MLRVTWFGHAAFLIEGDGLRVVLDPYRAPDCGGYRPIDEPADVVVVSHDNDRYHSHLGQIVPPFEVVSARELPTDGRDVRGVRFHAIPVYETPEKQAGDEVTIVHFRLAGQRVAFLGDLGHALSEAETTPLTDADLLLCPAGGPPTISLDLIPDLLQAIEPRVVIPMHYFIPGKINLPIQPLDRFLEAVAQLGWPVQRPGQSHFEIAPGPASMIDPPRIVCLEPAR